jgi:hypothetical protein
MSKERKNESLTVRITPTALDALRKLAAAEHRSVASYVELMILERAGLLAPANPAGRPPAGPQ